MSIVWRLLRNHLLAIASLTAAVCVLLVGGSSFWGLSLTVLAGFAVWHAILIDRQRRDSIDRLLRAADRIALGSPHGPHITAEGELAPLTDAMNRVLSEVPARQQQLTELANRLTTVLSAMVEGVLAVDHRQRILFANDAAGRLLGFDALQAQGKLLLEVVRNHMLHEAVAEALANRDLPDQETHRYEFDSHRARGQILSFRPTRLHGTPCPGVVLVLQDVTDLRRLEHLRQEFIANVSHELKTPLSAIKAYAETLLNGAVDDPVFNRTFTANIEQEAERLDSLIAKMLTLAKIESGHEPFSIVSVPVHELIQECFTRHEALATQNRLTLIVEPGEGQPHVLADREGLVTILNNLVDNAIKYTSSGGRIVIRTREEPGNTVCIEVSDSGVGIPQELQSRVFERFYRVDTSRSRELGSTGLGLAIVKHLVHTFGGSVSVTSEVERGSTFAVRLPSAASGTVGLGVADHPVRSAPASVDPG